MKPLNPEWDRRWMDSLAGGEADLRRLCEMTEDSIEEQAGLSAHESKTWLSRAVRCLPIARLPAPSTTTKKSPSTSPAFGAMLLKA